MKKIIILLLTVSLLCSCLAGCSKKRTAMEYKGMTLEEDLYSYWMATFKRAVLNYTSDAKAGEEYWNTEYGDGVTNGEYFNGLMQTQMKYYLVAQKLFDEYNLKLSDSIVQSIEDDINEKIEYYGSRAELNSVLAEAGMNIDTLKKAYTWEEKLSVVYDYLFSDGGQMETTAEQVTSYYENNYSRFEYCVLYTTKIVTDDDGNYQYDSEGNIITEEMTEEELQNVRELADYIESEAKNGTDFNVLMNEYSDYQVHKSYPGGLFISLNEVDTYGVALTLPIVNGNVGDIIRVDEESAIFIINKLELTPFEELDDEDINQLSSLEGYVADENYHKYFDELAAEVTVFEDVAKDYFIADVVASPSSKF